MPVELDKLRGQPLLQPPGADPYAWSRATDSDVAGIRAELAKHLAGTGDELDGWHVAFYNVVLRNAGVEDMVGSKERSMVGHYLDGVRASADQRGLLEAVYITRGLGMDAELNADEAENIRRDLAESRNTRAPYGIGKTVFQLKGLGLMVDADRDDATVLLSELDKQRGKTGSGEGRRIAQLHLYLKALGAGQNIPPGDYAAMGRTLDESRAKGEWTEVGELLLSLSTLLPKEAPEPAAMPPRRRFVG